MTLASRNRCAAYRDRVSLDVLQRGMAALSLAAIVLVWLVAFIPACLYVALVSVLTRPDRASDAMRRSLRLAHGQDAAR